MKRKKIYALLLVVLASTGCVKYNGSMTIRKDKSMDYSFIYALDKSLMEGQEGDLTENMDELKKMEEYGFKVTEYDKDDFKGFKFEKTFKNIDDVSATIDEKSEQPEIEYSLSNPMEEKDGKIFTIKKGFLKNKYIANFKFETDDSGFDGDNEDKDFDDEEFDTALPDEEDSTIMDDSEDFDKIAESMMKNLDLEFKISLPNKALSHNATDTNEKETELSWDLAKGNIKKIEFEFELYNMKNIYITGGVILLLFIIIFITSNIKGSKKEIANANNVMDNNTPNNLSDIQNEQSFNQIITPDVTNENIVSNNIPEMQNTNETFNQTDSTVTQTTFITPNEMSTNDLVSGENNQSSTQLNIKENSIQNENTQNDEPKINPFNI